MTDAGTIHNQFGEHLLNFIRKRVRSSDLADDIYQDVILKILSKKDQLNNRQSLKSWLFTIAKNQIIDHYRKQRQFTNLDALELELSDKSGTSDYKDLEGCLHGFINQLPDEYRQIVTLSEIHGKSQKELSESLGMNYVTVRSKVQRGRERIRKLIFDACAIEQDRNGGLIDCTPKAVSAGADQASCGCDS